MVTSTRCLVYLFSFLSCLLVSRGEARAQQTGFVYLDTMGTSGMGTGQISQPSGIALDPSENIWVADLLNCRVVKFNRAKEVVTTIGGGFEGCNPPADSVPLKLPYDVVVDSAGAVYVSESADNGHTIKKFSSTGDLLLTIGSFGSGDGQFNRPASMAFDRDGNLLVVDALNRRVQKVTPSGAFVSKFDTQVVGETTPSEPVGIGVLSNGDIVVSDGAVDAVKVFSSSGEFKRKFGSTGLGDGQFFSPTGIGIDAADNIIVTDDYKESVQQFNREGTFLANIGGRGNGFGQFIRPYDVAIDKGGTVFITEGNNDRVEIFGLPFMVLTSTAGLGSGVISSSEGLISCGSDCGDRYDSSKTLTLQASSNVGSYFTAWSGTFCAGENPTCSFTPAATTVETATFTPFPKVSITSKPSRKSKSKRATFRFSSTCQGATYQCRVDSGSFTKCASPKTYSKLKKGSHTFSVRAVKNGGVSQATSASWRVK